MDNQHKLIKGYRDLTQGEIDIMNKIKAKAEEVGELLNSISWGNPSGGEPEAGFADPRWYAIAKTDLQTGFMALVRSIAKPTTF